MNRPFNTAVASLAYRTLVTCGTVTFRDALKLVHPNSEWFPPRLAAAACSFTRSVYVDDIMSREAYMVS